MIIGNGALLLVYLFNVADATELFNDEYLNYDETKAFLERLANKYSSISNLYSIGKSVQGRDLVVLELSATSKIRLGVPNVKLIGNIHGNEPVGKELILRLAKFLVEEYENGTTSIQNLLNTTRIHLLATANPDGFEQARASRDRREECFSETVGRKNVKGVDLNKNFPMSGHQAASIQPETESIKRWMNQIPFVASLSVRTGNMVAVYSFDYQFESDDETVTSITPDDDVFRHLSSTYANKHPYMHEGKPCHKHHQNFENGITNGANWYPLTDSMQDYNYLRKGCMEITIELSCCKYPLANQLERIWKENKEPLISWLYEVHRGIKGTVTDARTSDVVTAILQIDGRPITFQTSEIGEFWRILLPGSYKMKVKSIQAGYKESTISFTVNEHVVTFINITLEPIYEEEETNVYTSTMTSGNDITIFDQISSSNEEEDIATENTLSKDNEIETERYLQSISSSASKIKISRIMDIMSVHKKGNKDHGTSLLVLYPIILLIIQSPNYIQC